MPKFNKALGKPKFQHDCDHCTFLGHFEDHDLYFCHQEKEQDRLEGSIIARYGNDGPEYLSSLPGYSFKLSDERAFRGSIAIRVAQMMAEELFGKFAQDPHVKGFRVVCRDDRNPDGSKGKPVLATSQLFQSEREAFNYMCGVSDSREPEVLKIIHAMEDLTEKYDEGK